MKLRIAAIVILTIASLVLVYINVTKVLFPNLKKGIEYVDEKGLKNIIQPIGNRIWEGRDSVPADTEKIDEKE